VSENPPCEIKFSAEKVYIHHWPPETPTWSVSRKEKVEDDINKNKEKKSIAVIGNTVTINNYKFDSVRKVGLTIPQFKRQSTMIFEGRCEEFHAHVHITTRSKNYLEIFSNLMKWRDVYFPDTPFLDSKN
jgi:hypothetical protein